MSLSKSKRGVFWATCGLLSFSFIYVGCAQEPEPIDLSSFRRSGESSFFCVGPDQKGAPLIDCPLGDTASDGGLTVGPPGYELHALVTQTLSAEVAVVRVSGQYSDGDSSAKVLDVDASNPGVTPLRVGAQPAGIATTPGGTASFVTVAEPGKEGIFALPTSCIFAPGPLESRRDLTTWPACRLPAVPGTIEVLVDPGLSSEGRDFCDAEPPGDIAYADEDSECHVDLSSEDYDAGRRKLVVALPTLGKLVVLDAQELLDRQPGAYDDCFVESEIVLESSVPEGMVQPLPPDMATDDQRSLTYPDLVGQYQAHPAGMDTQGDLLAVADRGAPLVHLIDARDPCALSELKPLYTASYADPTRVVTTSRLAISPLTKSDQQFIYAVDEVGDELASIVPFDVSATAVSRLPLLREGSPLLPYESPDRISFGAAVKDVAFAALDRPISDPVFGQSFSRVSCDPDPTISEDSPGAQYRPSTGSIGADPEVLRGVFAYALLSTGRIALVDIEDFDAACRRPISLNSSAKLDFRGCSSDDPQFDYYTEDQTVTGTPTVSNESSCRAVVPHRARSAFFFQTEEGSSIQSPSLQAFATLSRHGRSITISRLSPEGKKSPILLGVDFEGPDGAAPVPAQVYLGSKLLRADDPRDPLVIDPNVAERAAPVLPFYEPRAYPASEVVTVVYEGDFDRKRVNGRVLDPQDGVARFEDTAKNFCQRGVQGKSLTEAMGRDRFGIDAGGLERFTSRHSDYLQVTNLLLDDTDPYWSTSGAQCGTGLEERLGRGYELCDSLFRIGDADDLTPERDLSIVGAYNDHLTVAPRGVTDPQVAQAMLEVMQCCFPTPLEYVVRAGNQWVVTGSGSGFQHPVVIDEEDEQQACIYDPSPLRRLLWGRAFEVSNNNCDSPRPDDPDACGVGPRTSDDVICSYDASTGGVKLGSAVDSCIFNSLTRRFVIYRGLEPTLRDMSFALEVNGGFEGMGISVISNSSSVLPVSMKSLDGVPILGVVDSQNNGLSVVDLLTSQVAQNFY